MSSFSNFSSTLSLSQLHTNSRFLSHHHEFMESKPSPTRKRLPDTSDLSDAVEPQQKRTRVVDPRRRLHVDIPPTPESAMIRGPFLDPITDQLFNLSTHCRLESERGFRRAFARHQCEPGSIIFTEIPVALVRPDTADSLVELLRQSQTDPLRKLVERLAHQLSISLRQLPADHRTDAGEEGEKLSYSSDQIVEFKSEGTAPAIAGISSAEMESLPILCAAMLPYLPFLLHPKPRTPTVGVFETASALAHSCFPNTVFCYEGTRLLAIATRPIRPGDELTRSHIPIAELWSFPKAVRSQLLSLDQACSCEACSSSVPDVPSSPIYLLTAGILVDYIHLLSGLILGSSLHEKAILQGVLGSVAFEYAIVQNCLIAPGLGMRAIVVCLLGHIVIDREPSRGLCLLVKEFVDRYTTFYFRFGILLLADYFERTSDTWREVVPHLVIPPSMQSAFIRLKDAQVPAHIQTSLQYTLPLRLRLGLATLPRMDALS